MATATSAIHPAITTLVDAISEYRESKPKGETLTIKGLRDYLTAESTNERLGDLTIEDVMKLTSSDLSQLASCRNSYNSRLLACQNPILRHLGRPGDFVKIDAELTTKGGKKPTSRAYCTQEGNTTTTHHLELTTNETTVVPLKNKSKTQIKVSNEEIERVNQKLKEVKLSLTNDGDLALLAVNSKILTQDPPLVVELNGKANGKNAKFKVKIDKISEDPDVTKFWDKAGPIALGIASLVTAFGSLKFGDSPFGKLLGILGIIGTIASIPLYLWLNGHIGNSENSKNKDKSSEEKKETKPK